MTSWYDQDPYRHHFSAHLRHVSNTSLFPPPRRWGFGLPWFVCCSRTSQKRHISIALHCIFQLFSWFARDYLMDLEKQKSRHISGNDIYECVKFGADPNTNMDLVNLHVLSSGDCWGLVEEGVLWGPFRLLGSYFCRSGCNSSVR